MFKYIPLLLLMLPFLAHTSDYVATFTDHWIVILCGNNPQEPTLLDETRNKMKAEGYSAEDRIKMETMGETKAREVLKDFDITPKSRVV
jgi:hypothetical protein